MGLVGMVPSRQAEIWLWTCWRSYDRGRQTAVSQVGHAVGKVGVAEPRQRASNSRALRRVQVGSPMLRGAVGCDDEGRKSRRALRGSFVHLPGDAREFTSRRPRAWCRVRARCSATGPATKTILRYALGFQPPGTGRDGRRDHELSADGTNGGSAAGRRRDRPGGRRVQPGPWVARPGNGAQLADTGTPAVPGPQPILELLGRPDEHCNSHRIRISQQGVIGLGLPEGY